MPTQLTKILAFATISPYGFRAYTKKNLILDIFVLVPAFFVGSQLFMAHLTKVLLGCYSWHKSCGQRVSDAEES